MAEVVENHRAIAQVWSGKGQRIEAFIARVEAARDGSAGIDSDESRIAGPFVAKGIELSSGIALIRVRKGQAVEVIANEEARGNGAGRGSQRGRDSAEGRVVGGLVVAHEDIGQCNVAGVADGDTVGENAARIDRVGRAMLRDDDDRSGDQRTNNGGAGGNG